MKKRSATNARQIRVIIPPTIPKRTDEYEPVQFEALEYVPFCQPSSSSPTYDPPVPMEEKTFVPPPSLLYKKRPIDVTTSSFPQSLKILNPKAWVKLAEHLHSAPHVPVFVHGPTGCGKTRGVDELIRHLQMRPVTLDAVEADSTEQLVLWIRRTREAHTIKRKSVIVIDDMEGFTAMARAELARLSKDARVCLNPLIFICNARRDPLWKQFSANACDVRLFAPNQYAITKWFATCYQWKSAHDNVQRVGVSEVALRSRCDSLLLLGDLRRIVMALETCNRIGANMSLDHDSHIPNTFDASRKLLRGAMTPEAWTTFTEPRDANLVQYHVTTVAHDIEQIARCLDTFSLADTLLPDRFENVYSQLPFTHILQASAIHYVPNRSPNVGALYPPPRKGTTPLGKEILSVEHSLITSHLSHRRDSGSKKDVQGHRPTIP